MADMLKYPSLIPLDGKGLADILASDLYLASYIKNINTCTFIQPVNETFTTEMFAAFYKGSVPWSTTRVEFFGHNALVVSHYNEVQEGDFLGTTVPYGPLPWKAEFGQKFAYRVRYSILTDEKRKFEDKPELLFLDLQIKQSAASQGWTNWWQYFFLCMLIKNDELKKILPVTPEHKLGDESKASYNKLKDMSELYDEKEEGVVGTQTCAINKFYPHDMFGTKDYKPKHELTIMKIAKEIQEAIFSHEIVSEKSPLDLGESVKKAVGQLSKANSVIRDITTSLLGVYSNGGIYGKDKTCTDLNGKKMGSNIDKDKLADAFPLPPTKVNIEDLIAIVPSHVMEELGLYDYSIPHPDRLREQFPYFNKVKKIIFPTTYDSTTKKYVPYNHIVIIDKNAIGLYSVLDPELGTGKSTDIYDFEIYKEAGVTIYWSTIKVFLVKNPMSFVCAIKEPT